MLRLIGVCIAVVVKAAWSGEGGHPAPFGFLMMHINSLAAGSLQDVLPWKNIHPVAP